MTGGAPVLSLTGITKRFGTTTALHDVSMEIGAGEIRALLGRNGAGKSTLISIITGLLDNDEGTVEFDDSVRTTGRHPVACVYQKSTLVPDLSAAENVFLDAYPRNRAGLVAWRTQSADARALLGEWGCEEIVDAPVADLDPLQRKIVEICRALATGARILLLDEPTAGLDGDATRLLFDRVHELRKQGISVVFVSHYLDEVFELCDTVTVLRDGTLVETRPLDGLTVPDLVDLMVGEAKDAADVPTIVPAQPDAAPVIQVEHLTIGDRVRDFSLEIRPGECVGLVGLDGSGIIEIAQAIAGIRPIDGGSVTVRGKAVPNGSVIGAIEHGIGFLPEDRHSSGFVPGFANEENATLTILKRLSNRIGLISERKRADVYGELARSWEIKAASGKQATEELSGGNQQKVALARAFASHPDVLVLANPTAGVDVSAKASIVESVSVAVRTQQSACLIVSSDESEFGSCSRVLVLFRGDVIGELHAPWAENVLAAAVQGDISISSQTAA